VPIVLSEVAAFAVVGSAVVLAVVWGAFVSVRSAASGPGWAIVHLGTARVFSAVVTVLSLVAIALVRPVWVGLAVAYVSLVVWFLAAMIRRNLSRLAEAGGFDEIPPERRAAILARARRALLLVGSALLLVGLISIGTEFGALAWVGMAVGGSLLVTAVFLTRG
jgi:hypothetical protein